jgi:hypothetical protein
MREITDHVANPANDTLKILVTDEPGAGGANHRYVVGPLSMSSNPSVMADDNPHECLILFQNGPISVAGMNGITQEVLLAIVADRLRSFQAGAYACAENAVALAQVEAALNSLKQRTLARMARGVEGAHAV